MNRLAQYELGRHFNFVYTITDWNTRTAALVDCQEDLSPIFSDLKKKGVELKQILLTHTHWDHVAGIPELLKTHPTLPIYVHERDTFRLKDWPQENLRIFNDSTKSVFVGKTEVEIFPTPGHSAGGCCYLLRGDPPQLLTGDTLFIRNCGRTDLETGNTTQMFESLQRLKQLNPQTEIYPGHHYTPEFSSTLAIELTTNPALQCASVEELERMP